jgi:hypothetical protein
MEDKNLKNRIYILLVELRIRIENNIVVTMAMVNIITFNNNYDFYIAILTDFYCCSIKTKSFSEMTVAVPKHKHCILSITD